MFGRIKYRIRDIRVGIRNLKRWLPIIWADRDFDFRYFLDILSFKLSNMKYAAENYWISANALRDAKDMGIAIALIDRIANEYQQNLAFEKHQCKWGKPKLRWEPYEVEGFNKSIIDYPNVKTEEDEERQREDFRRVMLHARKAHEGYIEYLMKTLSKFERWWD